MEPVTIAIICAAVFGVVGILAAFIRQLLVSRDKNLNDQAQQSALAQEAKELQKIRQQMASKQRFDSHYQVLGSNKDAIQYLDLKIEDILKKKEELIHRFAQLTLKESSAIVANEQLQGRKEACDNLKSEIDKEIESYNNELAQLQKRRSSLWDTHTELQDYLLDQEKRRNKHLDSIYQHHSNLLEKIYLRHNHNSEKVALQSIDSSTQIFKTALMMPIEFLVGLFKVSSAIDLEQIKRETEARKDVADTESDLNDPDDVDVDDEDVLDDDFDEVVSDDESDDESQEDYRKKQIDLQFT